MKWTPANARRVIVDFANQLQGQPYSGSPDIYKEGLDLKEDLQLESIQVMDLAARVNAFFQLPETGPEQYLLDSSAVDVWVEKCVRGRQLSNKNITFLTSGTTGHAKAVTHLQAFLDREISFLCSQFQEATCIIPLVPSYSIYGYLFTIALPQALNVPVIFPGAVHWTKLTGHALIVGTPFTWSQLLRGMPERTIRAEGVCSTAPLSTALFRDILSRGVRIKEVYGATETAGVGWREQPDAPFKAFPYWSVLDEKTILDKESGSCYALMDRVEKLSADTFRVQTRIDQKLKIAGQLVDLSQVAQKIRNIEGVSDCTVSAKKQVDRTRITAVISLQQDSTEHRAALFAGIKANLAPAERPNDIIFLQPGF